MFGKRGKHILRNIDAFIGKRYKVLFELFILFFFIGTLFYTLDTSDIFRDSTPYGGDHAFHVANSLSFQRNILGEGRLNGWLPNIYGGMAFPDFYPPFIFWLVALLSIFIPWAIAYKLMVIIGLMFFPIAVYISCRKFKLKWPTTPLVLLGLFATFFQQHNFAFGGNLLSVISGEIAYLYGLSFFVLFISHFYMSLDKGIYKKRCAILLFLTCIAHPIPFAIACFSSLFVFFRESCRKDISHVLSVYVPGLLLSFLWLLPYFLHHKFGVMRFDQSGGYQYGWPLDSFFTVFPEPIIPILFVCVLFAVFSIGRFRKMVSEMPRPVFYVAWLSVVVNLFFLFGSLNPVRFLPILYILLLFLGSIFLTHIVFSEKYTFTSFFRKNQILLLLIIGLLLLQSVHQSDLLNEQAGADWIFSGYEHFISYNHTRFLANTYVAQVNNESRVDSSLADPFIARTFTTGNSFTGLFYHTLSAPPIQRFQSQLNKEGSEHASDIYSLYNVGWIVGNSEDGKAAHMENASEFSLETSYGEFVVYRHKDNADSYTSVIDTDLVVLTNWDEWQDMVGEWVSTFSSSSSFLVYDPRNDSIHHRVTDVIRSDCTVTTQSHIHSMTLRTNCPNEPHLIKMSYFPKWKSTSGEKLYVVSPSFMLVYPRGSELTITYENTWVEYLSRVLFFLGVIWLIFSRRMNYYVARVWLIVLKLRFVNWIFVNHKKMALFLLYILVVAYFVTILMMMNVTYDVVGRLTDEGHYRDGVSAFDRGDYKSAKPHLLKVQYNDRLETRSLFLLGQIYLSEGETEKAQQAIYRYINKGGRKTPELRYILLSYYRDTGDIASYEHEISVIQTAHPGDYWSELAVLEFSEWESGRE